MSPKCTSGWAWGLKTFEVLQIAEKCISYCQWWFHQHCHTQLDFLGYIQIPDLIPPRVKSLCHLPLLLVHWFYRKKNYHSVYSKAGSVCRQSMKKQVYILLDLQADQQHTNVTTQVISLNSCDLFLVILLTCIKQLNYCKVVPEKFDFVVQEIVERI